MKKLLIWLPVILIIGCGLFGGEDYYPLKVGNMWKYTGYNTMQDTSSTTIDTIAKMNIEKEITGTTQIGGKDAYIAVSKVTNYTYIPMIDTTLSVDTSYIVETKDTIWSYQTTNDTNPEIALVLPLELNKSWYQVFGTDTVTYTVIAKEDIMVAAGDYKDCWKVEMKWSNSNMKAYYWYANGTGTTKYLQHYQGGNILWKFWYELIEATIK